MRIDKVLWFLRLAGNRGLAHDWVLAGHIRLNGRRVAKPAQVIRTGDVLTLPLPGGVRVIEVLVLPHRRGPACEAQSCYRVLDGAPANPIADSQQPHSTGEAIP